ncbi:MAG: hypothetical protein EA366_02245 [Spirulina sp. DLM2.Bin59]|nr:MAG: hypothetical protein EA366_02245 [Spirulina sp. DLM2.Bin59]
MIPCGGIDSYISSQLGNGEWGMGNGERGMGNGLKLGFGEGDRLCEGVDMTVNVSQLDLG